MIEIKNLTKTYDKNPVLNNISLNFNEGEITAVMGPNGSGKTTLLKSILGLVKPEKGEIIVNTIKVNGNSEYRRHIGYMPQTPEYPDNLRVKELISMIKDVRGNHSVHDEELVKKLGMEKIYNKRFGTLSSGTKQRVSSSLAFLFNQEIIILDEPTAGLDPVSTEAVRDKITAERNKGKLIIITSHITSEVELLADRVVFLLEGRVLIDCSVKELIERTKETNLNSALASILNSNGV